MGLGWVGGEERGQASVSLHTHTHARARKDFNAFAFSPLKLSNPLIFRIVKYAKVTEVNR